MLLYAALPDRLHAEVLSPLGNPQLILDAGGGRLALTFVREAESFVGVADAGLLERLLGVRVGLAELVGALLEGIPPPDCRLGREGGASGALPERLAVDCGHGALTLRLRQMRLLGTEAGALGRGRPPDGVRQRPLEELEAEAERIERAAGTEVSGS